MLLLINYSGCFSASYPAFQPIKHEMREMRRAVFLIPLTCACQKQ